MRQLFKIAFGLTVVLSAGCAGSQGFDRSAMTEVLHIASSSDGGNRDPSSQNSALSPLVRLAVFFSDHEFPNHQSLRKVEWLSA
ncbi:MAG: hypothetical protein CV089_23635, partial [Nitrospira sp. WS110]|nr:hypothetical protein [Nitrospira sp. WS110]